MGYIWMSCSDQDKPHFILSTTEHFTPDNLSKLLRGT